MNTVGSSHDYLGFIDITDRSKAVLLVWFSVYVCSVLVSVLFSPSIRLNDIKLGLGS